MCVLNRTTAFGYYAQNSRRAGRSRFDHLAAPGRDMAASGCGRCGQRRWKRHRRLPSATWCSPTTIGWQVMLASAARTYLNHYGVAASAATSRIWHCQRLGLCGRRSILKKAGVNVAAIVDLRDNLPQANWSTRSAANIEIHDGRAVFVSRRLRVNR